MVYMNGVVLLTQQRGRGNSICTRCILCLKIHTHIAPCSWVQLYRLTSTLCQRLCLSYFGCPCSTSRSRNWQSFDHCFARVWCTWRRSAILEFSLFCEQKLAFLVGAKFFSSYGAKYREPTNDRSDACNIWRWNDVVGVTSLMMLNLQCRKRNLVCNTQTASSHSLNSLSQTVIFN
jgi:hypothetical protein